MDEITDHPDMTLAVDHGHEALNQANKIILKMWAPDLYITL